MIMRSAKIIFTLLCLVFAAGIPLNVSSQSDTTKTITDPEADATKSPPHSFYTSAGYGSNMIYLGSTLSQNQSYGYGSLIYGFKDEFFISVSGVGLARQDEFPAFCIASLSYSHTFNSWFDISAGIYRYQFSKSLVDSLFDNFFYGDITLGFDWKILYSKISAGSLFSYGKQGYVQLRNSRYFQIPAFSKKNVYFSFDPYVNLLFGSLTRIETSTDTIITISYPFLKNISGSISGSGSGKTNGYGGGGMGSGAGSGVGTGSGTTSTTPATSQATPTNFEYLSSFGFLEIDFGLPISFNTSRLTIEAEPGYVLPVYDDPVYQGLKGFNFMLSIYLKIF
jgi:hypothetical protein